MSQDALEQLHAEVERDSARLSALHHERLQCRLGCAQCCVDDLTVFAVEAARIAREAWALLREGEPHPPGACAMLDPQTLACRVYDSRPYVCRTQGLPLRWLDTLDDEDDGELMEFRDICPLNDDDFEPLEELPAEDCWELGPVEGRLALIQQRADAAMPRVALRSLFRRS